jgi:hypothetical protein
MRCFTQAMSRPRCAPRRLNDGDDGSQLQLHTDLLKLHQLSMDGFYRGAQRLVPELFDLAVELEDQVLELMTSVEEAQDALEKLEPLYPHNLPGINS